jgi:hypothetical protein
MRADMRAAAAAIQHAIDVCAAQMPGDALALRRFRSLQMAGDAVERSAFAACALEAKVHLILVAIAPIDDQQCGPPGFVDVALGLGKELVRQRDMLGVHQMHLRQITDIWNAGAV